MKRLLSLGLVFVLVFLQFVFILPSFMKPATAAVQPDLPEFELGDMLLLEPAVDFDFDFAPPSPAWLQLAASEKPAEFSQVEYVLADDVLDITGSDLVVESIASEGQLLAGSMVQKQKPAELIKNGARLSRSVLDQAAAARGRQVTDGTVVIDRKSQTAFKVAGSTTDSGLLQEAGSAMDNTYSLAATQLSDVFKDLSLGGPGGETIELTRANITGFAPGVEESVVIPGSQVETVGLYDEYDGYKYIFGEKLVDLHFKDKVLGGTTKSGKQVQVKLSGGLGVESLKVSLQYTCCRGYYFSILVRQECYLTTELSASLDEEIMINLFGINAGIEDIGHVTGGLFLIIGLDGKLRLEIAVREHASVLVGARGRTGAYIPVSVKPIFDYSIQTEGDVQFTGRINGYIKAGPLARLELFGFSLVGAGLLLGAGIEIKADGLNLDVHFYGILLLYLDLIGNHFDLVEYYPTIWQRKQRNTAGHTVTFQEVFTYPGRVSGILKKEELLDDGRTSQMIPARDAPYRILVIPKTVPYDPGNLATSLQDKSVRRYPKTDWARTDQEGIFFQKDKLIINGGDKVILEFQVEGRSLYSDAVEATLPFSNITIERADHYNEYVIGRVEPICLINYDADPADQANRYEYFYYADGPVSIRSSLYSKDIHGGHWQNGPAGYTYAQTDAQGRFDSRAAAYDKNGQLKEDWQFDIRPGNAYKNEALYRTLIPTLHITLDYNEILLHCAVEIEPELDLHFSRFIQEVPGSYQRLELPDGRLMDQMVYDEYIFIDNMFGSRAIAPQEFCYLALPFSTRGIRKPDPRLMSKEMLEQAWRNTSPITHSSTVKAKNLLNLPDEEGNPSGTSLFFQRVTVEYVWQEHPNPVRITSPDHCETLPGPDIFQVKAEGFAPFAFSLASAAEGISINRDSGMISLDQALAAGSYEFTIIAAENRDEYRVVGPDGLILDTSKIKGPYQGSDPSPPAKQLFTLQLLAPDPEPTPTPEPLLAPLIAAADHAYQFSLLAGQQEQKIQVKASGSTPLIWSLQPHAHLPFPAGCKIDKNSGILTLGSESVSGEYGFIIQVVNEAGQARQGCSLEILEPPGPPVIQDPFQLKNPPRIEFGHIRGKDVQLELQAKGSQPISWSLEPSGNRPFPEGIYIDEDTGVLTLDKHMSGGSHVFVIRAENEYGSDSRECSVLVVSRGSMSANSQSGYTLLSSADDAILSQDLLEELSASIAKAGPPNSLTLRYDNPAEAYTSDRESKNGATYVRWFSATGMLEHFIVGTGKESKYWEGWTGEVFRDAVPLSADYQYTETDTNQGEAGEINDYLQNKLHEYKESEIDQGYLSGQLQPSQLPLNPVQIGAINQMLPYRDILDAIRKQKGSQTKLELDDSSGTTIPGEVLETLAEDPAAELIISQEDMTIQFSGQDLDQTGEDDLLDLGYQKETAHAETLREKAGTDNLFTCSFTEQRQLPGRASFTVKTDLAPGSTVYIYQYDPVTGELALVAADLLVGRTGQVSYRHDQLGILAITDQELPVDRILPAAGWQQMPDRPFPWYYLAGGAGLLLVVAGLAGWLIGSRTKKKKVSPA